MGGLYHGPRDASAFGTRVRKPTLFLPASAGSPILGAMSIWRSTAAVGVALVAALSVGLPAATGHARSYGKVDAMVVRKQIQRDLPKINRCYESALRREPDLAGKVKVRFAIVRSGDVSAVQVLENTTGHQGVERCVARVLGDIQFPSRRSGKALSFTFPFVFARQ
jgi:outer membrane biosynthesis protein TonB